MDPCMLFSGSILFPGTSADTGLKESEKGKYKKSTKKTETFTLLQRCLTKNNSFWNATRQTAYNHEKK